MSHPLSCTFVGLSITSTWGNGHATTYRGLLKELRKRGHICRFLERDVPWYSENREFSQASYCDVRLYKSVPEFKERFASLIRSTDVVIVGSYVPDGIEIGNWVQATARNCTAFYDIDTPVTLAGLADGSCQYLRKDLIPRYGLYLSFTGGPTLSFIERDLGSPRAVPLYCSVDPSLYFPEKRPTEWDLGYIGTYAADRQPALQRLLSDVAADHSSYRFVVAGPQYPESITWPDNVERLEHVPASEHRRFYNAQRFTLNLTRLDMVRAGYSPSVRLFEAAACGVPILTDIWPGLDQFFSPGSEILPVRTPADVTSYLQMSDEQRQVVGEQARIRTLARHTAAVRASEFEGYVQQALERRARHRRRSKSPALI